MEIEKLLPPFTKEHTCIFIIGQGHEVLARNMGEGWEIKTERCSQCAKCCFDGGCDYIEEIEPGKYRCAHPDTMPWPCVRGSGEPDYCKMKFEKVE